MKAYDIYPTNQVVPAGYEKLVNVRDRLGADTLLVNLQTDSIKAYEYNPEDGGIEVLEIFEWRSEFSGLMMKDGYKQHYFVKELPNDPANSRKVFFYGQTWRLLLIKSGENTSLSTTMSRNYGGRPAQYDWEGMIIELARHAILNEDEIPKRSVLNKIALEWFSKTIGAEPPVSSVRDHVKRFHDRIWPPKT